jgi:hypothetical protein
MFKTTRTVAVISAVLTFPITAYADAKAEIATAAQHAGMAAAAPSLAQVHTHLHHAMNCLVGPRDADFDKNNMNPCAQQGAGAFPDESNPDIKVKLQNACRRPRMASPQTTKPRPRRTPPRSKPCLKRSSSAKSSVMATPRLACSSVFLRCCAGPKAVSRRARGVETMTI